MKDIADALTFSLQKPVSPESLGALRAETTLALERGVTGLAIDVDDVGILDSQVISTLIAILRDVRERGASVELRARRQSILDTLRITALDKVFTIVEPARSATPVRPVARKTPPPPRRGRLVASVAAGAFAAASLLGGPAAADPSAASHLKAGGAEATLPRDSR